MKQKIVMFFATGFYIGNIPVMPGTFGTLVGIPFFFLLAKCSVVFSFYFIVSYILFSIWISQEAEKVLNSKDPGCVVIDEIAGYLVTVFALPFNVYTVIGGFLLFRLFDILKPFPVSYFDKKLSGGSGIVLDDIAAGVMAGVSLRIILKLAPL